MNNNIQAAVHNRTVYHATINSDDMEGRGRTLSLGYYTEDRLARLQIDGSWTGRIEAKETRVVQIDGRLFLVGDEVLTYDPKERTAELKRKLQSTFSAEELTTLGIKI